MTTEAQRRRALELAQGPNTIATSEWFQKGGSFRSLFQQMYGEPPRDVAHQHLDAIATALASGETDGRRSLAAELLGIFPRCAIEEPRIYGVPEAGTKPCENVGECCEAGDRDNDSPVFCERHRRPRHVDAPNAHLIRMLRQIAEAGP